MTWTATNSEGYPAPVGLATDVVVLAVRGGRLCVLLVRRPDGALALPGGFVGPDERPHDTALRHLGAKGGVEGVYLEQLGAFADPGRDPRGWIPSVAYLALVPDDLALSGDGATWAPARTPPSLAFDHEAILATALDRVEGKLWWSNVAVGLLPASFTLSEARRAYEAIAGTRYDAATFARDLRATGLIDSTGRKRREGPGRPAEIYRFTSRQLAWGAGRRKRVATGAA